MNKGILILTLALSLGLTGCGNKTNDSSVQKSDTTTKGVEQNVSNKSEYEIKDSFIKGTVDNIMDGDSLYITWSKDGSEDDKFYNMEFYLEGIDAPEIVHPVYKKMPYGDEAKKNLESLVSPGDEVYIESTQDELNKSVPMAFIYIKTGNEVKQLSNEQVKSGLAYVKNDDFLNKQQQEKLKKTESQAKEQSLGIWSDKELVVDGKFNSKYIKEGREHLLEENND